MTDEEIITKAFNDNACKYEDWKDCCVAMMRDAMEMKKTQISKELKFDVDKLTLGDLKFAKVMSFANEIRQEKYCRKYMDCHVCPLFIQKEQNRECIDSIYFNELYKKIFLDGFKAAFDVLIEKIKSLLVP